MSRSSLEYVTPRCEAGTGLVSGERAEAPPLLDRIDMHVEVPAVSLREFRGYPGERPALSVATSR